MDAVERCLAHVGILCYAEGSLRTFTYFVPFAARRRAVAAVEADPVARGAWIVDEEVAQVGLFWPVR